MIQTFANTRIARNGSVAAARRQPCARPQQHHAQHDRRPVQLRRSRLLDRRIAGADDLRWRRHRRPREDRRRRRNAPLWSATARPSSTPMATSSRAVDQFNTLGSRNVALQKASNAAAGSAAPRRAEVSGRLGKPAQPVHGARQRRAGRSPTSSPTAAPVSNSGSSCTPRWAETRRAPRRSPTRLQRPKARSSLTFLNI